MRFPAGPIEIMAIEEPAYLVDALCSVDEKYVDKLAQGSPAAMTSAIISRRPGSIVTGGT